MRKYFLKRVCRSKAMIGVLEIVRAE